MKRIFDPRFSYQPSFATDIRKTFARYRKALRQSMRETMQETKICELQLAAKRPDRRA
jgi:hypothetical protein